MLLVQQTRSWLYKLLGITQLQILNNKECWITNYRDASSISDERGNFFQEGNIGSLCTTCKKQMLHGWDTVCYSCGDTSCYNHSIVVAGRWYCIGCDPSLDDEFRQIFPGWRGQEAECFRKKNTETHWMLLPVLPNRNR